MWIIFLYIILSCVIAGSAGLTVGLSVGLYALATSILSLVAGSGLKASLWWGEGAQKIAGPVIAILIMALAQWLALGFSARLFGFEIAGVVWSWIGFAVCFVFTYRQVAAV